MNKLSAGLVLLGSLVTQSALAELPAYSKRVLVTDQETGEKVSLFESDEIAFNDVKVFYYLPTGLKLHRNESGKADFKYTAQWPSAFVSFHMKLHTPPLLTERRDFVKGFLAERYDVSEDEIFITPIPFESSEASVFMEEGVVSQILPPENMQADSKLPFYFSFDNFGSQFFRENIIESKMLLGSLKTTVLFSNGDRTRTQVKRFPISLEEVPLCAVTINGCLNPNW